MSKAPDPGWVVLKFGGTSVSSLESWRTIARVVAETLGEGLRPLVVCSALSGITNDLEKLCHEAITGSQEATLAEIRRRHRVLAETLDLDASALLLGDQETLARLAMGISLVREVTPRVRAQVLGLGESMSTRLGAAFLARSGISVAWIDSRDYLRAETDETNPRRHYLSAICSQEPNEVLRARMNALPAASIMTQGFVAADAQGETVLLGRGGSDTSATCFAAQLSALRCEIWTDVPGVYSADPRIVPEARLIRRLDYDEAQEVASAGGKVLHPRCIPPARRHSIPIHIRSTPHPMQQGTIIAPNQPDLGAEVKAIAARTGISLISMESVGMWQQVGFLADAFARFRDNGISIDMISTSETNVTVSIDPGANPLAPDALKEILHSLEAICRARAIGPCAAVSLVGRNIRSLLPRLGPALEAFEEQNIHMVSQASSDLNLTFVVDEDQAERMVRRLHALIFESRHDDPLLGPTWGELAATTTQREPVSPWWMTHRADLLELAARHSPCYVYHLETIEEAVREVRAIDAVGRILYAIKANPHPAILSALHRMGICFECASLMEVEHVLRVLPGILPDRVLFTPNFAPREEYEAAFAREVHVTVDNVYPLRKWPGVFDGREIFLRVDPGEGRGHHHHVRTGGAGSKFGITVGQIEEVEGCVRECGARVVGLHAHTGSGILSAVNWIDTALFLASLRGHFPHARILDLGGGLGVPERSGQPGIDMAALNERLRQLRSSEGIHDLWLEPGRFLVARAGVLLARVTQTKEKGDLHYVGIETGMNTLIRPALYGAWHEIVNLTRLDEPVTMVADIVGPICESGDVLGHKRFIAAPEEGDVIAIACTGAYGHAMGSRYNLREPAEEHVLIPGEPPGRPRSVCQDS